jgi:hypothetical protein
MLDHDKPERECAQGVEMFHAHARNCLPLSPDHCAANSNITFRIATLDGCGAAHITGLSQQHRTRAPSFRAPHSRKGFTACAS